MTEAEWLKGTDATPMLEFIRRKVSGRKLRLFAVACVQRYPNSFPPIGEVIRVAERYADGAADWQELSAARRLARELQRVAMQRRVGMGAGAVSRVSLVASESAWEAAECVNQWDMTTETGPATVLRDLFGNPFRPVAFSLAWRTSTVLALAEGIYAERAFDRLPILADALQEAGCDSDDVLAHCRGDGPHVRGCWVVDGIIGKE